MILLSSLPPSSWTSCYPQINQLLSRDFHICGHVDLVNQLPSLILMPGDLLMYSSQIAWLATTGANTVSDWRCNDGGDRLILTRFQSNVAVAKYLKNYFGIVRLVVNKDGLELYIAKMLCFKWKMLWRWMQNWKKPTQSAVNLSLIQELQPDSYLMEIFQNIWLFFCFCFFIPLIKICQIHHFK